MQAQSGQVKISAEKDNYMLINGSGMQSMS